MFRNQGCAQTNLVEAERATCETIAGRYRKYRVAQWTFHLLLRPDK